MNENIIGILFALLRSAICGDMLTEQEIKACDGETLSRLIDISKKHDIIHLVALGLERNSIITNSDALSNEIIKAVYRYEQIKYEYESLCKVLEAAKIPFMPLKGAIIRDYYPEPWMRTSCDIDVLVHSEDTDKAVECLIGACGYVKDGQCSHDISLMSPGKIHIELHYDLLEGGVANKASEVLENIWDIVTVRDGYSYFYEMSDEMFYFYHVAHMAKHFENGGCGIRPFIDLWILDGIFGADNKKRNELLEKGELLRFAETARSLSKVWLDKQEHDDITEQTERYILSGGVYGTNKNRVAIQHYKKGGRTRYILYKIFLPYNVIKSQYPILKKHRWLTPFMEVRRWFRLLFKGHFKRVSKDLKCSQSLSDDESQELGVFLEQIGLKF